MGRAQFDQAGFLAAARALIAERGPQAVTVDSVAERLKAPKGSFYYRFASRDALLGEVWLDDRARLSGGVRRRDRGGRWS